MTTAAIARRARSIARALLDRSSASAAPSARHATRATSRDVRAIGGGSRSLSVVSSRELERASPVRRASSLEGCGGSSRCRTFASSSSSSSSNEGEKEEGGEGESESAAEDAGWVFGVKNQRRPTRRDKGSYDAFLTEIDSYPTRHDVRDVYNAREWVETSLEESCAQAEALVDKMLAGMKEMERLEEKYADVFPAKGMDGNDPNAVLTWTSEFVMEPGEKQEHPLNWKVSVEVKLSELQRVTGLSDEAIDYIKLLVDKRYNPKQDMLKIVCRRNNNREHNRQWCLKVLYDLIQEGNREYPSDSYRFTPDLAGSGAVGDA